MLQTLEKLSHEVTCLGPVNSPAEKIGFGFDKFSRQWFKRGYAYQHSIMLSKSYARIFKKKLLRGKFDVIFAPAASTEIAYLDTEIPILYFSDTTFHLMVDYYPGYFSNLLSLSISEGNHVEHMAIKRATLAVFASRWAAESALDHYGQRREKIHVVPLGANLEYIPERNTVLNLRKSEKCRLLFLGRTWDRKGGDIALETLDSLQRERLPVELVICGCAPPNYLSPEFSSKKGVALVPWQYKDKSEEFRTLEKLFLEADFLFLPTRADCYLAAVAEANAYGVPAITSDVGGVKEVVRNGENGFALPQSACGDDYAKVILDIYKSDSKYADLCRSSRDAFETRLNWDQWGKGMERLLTSLKE